MVRRLRSLQNALKTVAWGSVHDRMSGPAVQGIALPMAHKSLSGLAIETPEGQAWLQKIGAISPSLDHLTEHVLPEGRGAVHGLALQTRLRALA